MLNCGDATRMADINIHGVASLEALRRLLTVFLAYVLKLAKTASGSDPLVDKWFCASQWERHKQLQK